MTNWSRRKIKRKKERKNVATVTNVDVFNVVNVILLLTMEHIIIQPIYNSRFLFNKIIASIGSISLLTALRCIG